MTTTGKFLEVIWIFFIFIMSMSSLLGTFDEARKLYIVYMGSLPVGSYSPMSHHQGILQSVVDDESLIPQVLHLSYGRSFNGFAAWLTNEEQAKLSDMDGISYVFRNPTLELCTTRSWDFMGLTNNVKRNQTLESDIIIGMLDSGVWPESDSFSDLGIGPVPKKWKGTCDGGANFTCNRKIIGAKIYGGETNARDHDGHGTHTASIAAGNKVEGASFFGIANGTARGGVPSARIAVYKVCTKMSCDGASILAGFDDAIADGVDIISVSIGNSYPTRLEDDVLSIGSFHAMTKNILTVHGAGNGGNNGLSTIFSLAPWMMTVGSSTSDRKFIDKVILSDGSTITGISLNRFSLGREPKYPIISVKKFNSYCKVTNVRSCSYPCRADPYWKGKILMCDYAGTFANTSAAGVIALSNDNSLYYTYLPGVTLNSSTFNQVAQYADTTDLRGTILKSEVENDISAPKVSTSSSLGPNTLFPYIMKPDVVAPGVNIFAAVTPGVDKYIPPTVQYFFHSGTSMACPHVSGAAAYVKSMHPNWSPAAIKSALMTTSRLLNASAHPDREFAYGSGFIDPVKASNPGLIYDMSIKDCVNLLCSVYDSKTCKILSGKNCLCPKDKISSNNFNYPSFTAFINTTLTINVNFTRVVTNVGNPNSTYKVNIMSGSGLNISVVPNSMSFKTLDDKKSFVVSVNGRFPKDTKTLSSYLIWSDGTHSVKSPIVIYRSR